MKAKLSENKKWYTKNQIVIALLVLLFPVGLFLMWKHSDWTKRTKIIVSVIVAIAAISGVIASYNSPPSISVNNAQSDRINTDDKEYTLTGEVSSLRDATLTINEESVSLDGIKFSYHTELEEGDNTFTLVATNSIGETTKVITIYRTTQAELDARAEAERLEAEKKAEEKRRKQEEEKKKEQDSQSNNDQPSEADQKPSVDLAKQTEESLKKALEISSFTELLFQDPSSLMGYIASFENVNDSTVRVVIQTDIERNEAQQVGRVIFSTAAYDNENLKALDTLVVRDISGIDKANIYRWDIPALKR